MDVYTLELASARKGGILSMWNGCVKMTKAGIKARDPPGLP